MPCWFPAEICWSPMPCCPVECRAGLRWNAVLVPGGMPCWPPGGSWWNAGPWSRMAQWCNAAQCAVSGEFGLTAAGKVRRLLELSVKDLRSEMAKDQRLRSLSKQGRKLEFLHKVMEARACRPAESRSYLCCVCALC